MQKRDIWINGMFALAGLLIGATVTYFYTMRIEERKISFAERRDGYEEFFEATSKFWQSQDKEKEAAEAKRSGDNRRAIELDSEAKKIREGSDLLYKKARFKIGVFSDSAVVQTVAKYWRSNFKINTCENTQRFLDDVATYQAMRCEMKARGEVQNRDMILVLFNCELKE